MEESEVKKIIYVDDIKFTLDEKTNYYSGCNKGRKIRLHCYIWEKHNGTIPKRYHVHHIDRNKLNNDISNLMIMSASDHRRLHESMITEEQVVERRRILDEYARPKACEWHGSDKGIEWHKEHGKEVVKKLKENKIKKTCKCCGKEFYDNGFNKALFCSNKCKSKWRRQEGLDNETRKCIICGKEFITNKYSKAKTCSESCGSVYAYSRRKGRINYEAREERDGLQYDSGEES